MKVAPVNPSPSQLNPLWISAGGTHDILEVVALQSEKVRSVFRLRFDNGHPPVIAKHCPAEDAATEYHFYRHVLPRLGIQAPCAFGNVAAEDSGRSWLFMEDIGGRPYDSSSDLDQELAGEWLAVLHTLGDQAQDRSALKNRACDYYGQYVTKCEELLSHHHTNPVLTMAERQLLGRLRAFAGRLAEHWTEIVSFCEDMPQTLIHGDFKEDNMRVVETPSGPKIIAFDWANSGWGAAGLDLAKFAGYSVAPALQPYLRLCRRKWPWLDETSVVRLAYIGEIFRWAETVRWHVEEIDYGLQATAMERMAVYETWMGEIDRVVPWQETDLVASGRWSPMKKHWR